MGCTKSKNVAKRASMGSEVAGNGSESGLMDSNDLSEEEQWRNEPFRALNHFVKGTGDQEGDDEYFSGDNSMFDYFQDDVFVELRTMLDEPLGRSHFLAFCEHHTQEESVNLVRLWLLLHRYHHAVSNEERYEHARNIYKHYFQIPMATKASANRFYRENMPSDMVNIGKEDVRELDDAGDKRIDFLEEYQRMLVPEVSKGFPRKIVSLIISVRPTVEQALLDCEGVIKGRRVTSASMGQWVDLGDDNPSMPMKSLYSPRMSPKISAEKSIPEMAPLNLNESGEIKTEQTTSTTTTTSKPDAVEENAASSTTSKSTEEESAKTLTNNNQSSTDLNPPPYLFIDLQSAVFQEMRPLYLKFKDNEPEYNAYKQSKKTRYNRVLPDDFDYLNMLGKGGFGHVVHVKKKSTGQHYAMKIQAKDTLLATWGGKMQHVEIERDVLVAHRSFPFIVSLRYAFQNDKYAFLALDLAEQGSLRTLLENSPGFQLEIPQIRLYVAELVLALECLHDHEIIYRDLKPENVLLCSDGHIMLADMGLAGFYYQDKYDEDEFFTEAGSDTDGDVNRISDFDDFDDEDDNTSMGTSVGVKSVAESEVTSGKEDNSGSEKLAENATLDKIEFTVSRTQSVYSTTSADTKATAKTTNTRRTKVMTSHDTDCGTPLYRPPEMVAHEHYNEGVDFFMLGVFTFECLVGHLPFEPKDKGITDSGFIEIEDDAHELRILKKKIILPQHLDQATHDLLRGLLDMDPATRLGVGPPEMKRDLQSLKDSPFFIPLAGPLATSVDWEKVLRKEYKPVFIPPPKDIEEKKKFTNFDALVKSWKKSARKEAKEYAKRRKMKADYENAPFVNEGKAIDPQLEHYFDNWDYLDPQSINMERTAIRSKSLHNIQTINSTGSGPKRSVSRKLNDLKYKLLIKDK